MVEEPMTRSVEWPRQGQISSCSCTLGSLILWCLFFSTSLSLRSRSRDPNLTWWICAAIVRPVGLASEPCRDLAFRADRGRAWPQRRARVGGPSHPQRNGEKPSQVDRVGGARANSSSEFGGQWYPGVTMIHSREKVIQKPLRQPPITIPHRGGIEHILAATSWPHGPFGAEKHEPNPFVSPHLPRSTLRRVVRRWRRLG